MELFLFNSSPYFLRRPIFTFSSFLHSVTPQVNMKEMCHEKLFAIIIVFHYNRRNCFMKNSCEKLDIIAILTRDISKVVSAYGVKETFWVVIFLLKKLFKDRSHRARTQTRTRPQMQLRIFSGLLRELHFTPRVKTGSGFIRMSTIPSYWVQFHDVKRRQ